MNRSLIITLIAAAAIVILCFQSWIFIPELQKAVSGIDTEGTRFGKPAYMHFVMVSFTVIFSLIPTVWAKRFNLFFSGFNLAWAVKNYVLYTRCEAGECPEVYNAIYLLLAASVVLLLATLFPKVNMGTTKK